MNLVTLASFNLVATHGGFGQAARAGEQPKATLSRHVRQLEEELGIRLVERGLRTLRLTSEGAALHLRTSRLVDEIEEAAAEIADERVEPRGRLRVSAPLLFNELSMGRLAAKFAKSYPDVLLDVTGEDRVVDPVEEGYDAIIRVDPRPESNLVGQCFLRDRTHLVASSRFGDPFSGRAEGPLAVIPAIILNTKREDADWPVWLSDELVTLPIRPALRLSSLISIREAARSHAGFAMLPRSIVAQDLEDGRLVSWGCATDREVEVWVLHTSRRLVSRKVAAFVAFLREAYPGRQFME